MPNQLGSLGAGGGSEIAYTLYDQFTDTDTTAIASHVIAPTNTPATSWTLGAGTITIVGNKTNCSGTASNIRAWTSPGVSNCTVSADVTVVSVTLTGGHAIVFRVQDDGNLWYADLVGVNNLFRIVERNATTETVRASTSFTVAATTYALKIVLSGDAIVATVNAGNQISYNSSLFNTATKHGIRGANGVTNHDNFMVTTP